MYKGLGFWLSFVILSSAPSTLLAQDYDYHPFLSDSFTASIGYMRSSNSFRIEADDPTRPEIPGEEIDFEDALGVSSHSTFFNGQLRWKIGREKKWTLSGQYFSNDAKGSSVLTEDVWWDGDLFREGTFVEAGIKLAVSRLFVGRSFIKNARNDFGVGAGIHNLDMKAFIEGEIIVNDESTGIERAEISGSQILPNIGGWYNFSPAKKWLLHARADWISANIGDYGGHMWNTSVGVNYQAWRHVGFDLAWQYFNVNVTADKDDWKGGADMIYSGPVLAVTFGW